MTVVIFAGPTISRSRIEALIDALVLPPAAMGDVLDALAYNPRVIGLIDGYFHNVPSVWHKEILWALSQGTAVFGAASMGALRAAELHPFGMTGIGAIFEAFRDGELEDDDEVAVEHGPAGTGYLGLSEALVNIRATLKRAQTDGIIGASLAGDLVCRAKALPFGQRSWEKLLQLQAADGDHGPIDALQNWLPAGRSDQKLEDAEAMIRAIQDHLLEAPDAPPVSFDFQWTIMWDRLKRAKRNQNSPTVDELVLDCLRCEPERYQSVRRRGAVHLFDQDPAILQAKASEPDLKRAMVRFRTQKNLFSTRDLDAWLMDQGLDLSGLRVMLAGEVGFEVEMARVRPHIGPVLISELKRGGEYAQLAEKAVDMMRRLDEFGARNPGPAEAGVNPSGLRLWFFEGLLGQSVPDDFDHFLQVNDFVDRWAFERMAVRLYVGLGQ